jgi:hypothetical protein
MNRDTIYGEIISADDEHVRAAIVERYIAQGAVINVQLHDPKCDLKQE